MIVRDEEENLPRCLGSIAPHVQEIAVIDTGSQDRSVEIARSFGAAIGFRAWDDDFAAARNASLELAREPWILVLDADEEFDVSTLPALERAMEGSGLARLVRMRLLDTQGGYQEVPLPRLFRNRPDLRYRRPIHESVLEDLWELGETAPAACGVVLLHHGYHAEDVAGRGKIERNLRIHRHRRERGEADLFDLFKEAQILLRPEEARERREVLEEAFRRLGSAPPRERKEWPWAGKLRALFGQDLFYSGEMARAATVLVEDPDEVPTPELSRARLELAWRSGHPADPADLERLRSLGDVSGLRTARIRKAQQEGDAAALEALASGGDVEASVWLSLLLLERERMAEGMRRLAPFLASEAPEACVRFASGVFLAKNGDLKSAADLLSSVDNFCASLAAAWLSALRFLGGTDAAPLLEEMPEPAHVVQAGLAAALADMAGVRVEIDPGFKAVAVERQAEDWKSFLRRSP
jgi:hypothetical protein